MAAQKGDANDRIIQNEPAAVWLWPGFFWLVLAGVGPRELLDMKRILVNFVL